MENNNVKLGFTHQSHRNMDYIELRNKNNLKVALEVVFSSFQSMMQLIENLINKYSKITNEVKGYVDKK